ncbi:MAG: T9SS type A sorting domain-containing protein [Bacteroidota bacterium]
MKKKLLSLLIISISHFGYSQVALDTSFGTGGIVETKVGQLGYPESYNAIQIQNDGKYIVAGYSTEIGDQQCVIARYNADGTMDASFGPGGIVKTKVGQKGIVYDESYNAIQIQNDGKYIVAGYSSDATTQGQCVIARYMNTTVGIIENNFGNELIVYPNPTSGDFSVNLGATYENAKIIITDVSGKMILSKTMTQSKILNLSIKEPVGIYIVSIQAGNKSAVIRLVKE